MRTWFSKVPTGVAVTMIIVCGLLAAMLVGSFVILTLNGADTTEFRQWVNTLGQILVYPFLGLTSVAAVSAARSSSRAEDQTNGHLSEREDEITRLRAALEQARKDAK